jgi:large subunit ribosomal protein L28
MSRRCDVTGAEPSFGNRVSHSHRRTRRTWVPNLHRRRFWLPSERRWITLKVTTKALRTIDRDGIEKVVAKMRAAGKKV